MARGVCPCGCTRRMAELAAPFTAGGAPCLPVRPCVFSVPKRLRPYSHCDSEMTSGGVGSFLRAIRSTLEATGPGGAGWAAGAQVGAVPFLPAQATFSTPGFTIMPLCSTGSSPKPRGVPENSTKPPTGTAARVGAPAHRAAACPSVPLPPSPRALGPRPRPNALRARLPPRRLGQRAMVLRRCPTPPPATRSNAGWEQRPPCLSPGVAPPARPLVPPPRMHRPTDTAGSWPLRPGFRRR